MWNLQRILDRHRVQWKDHGANCSRDNTNIPCPFCRDDPSYHMAVRNDGSAYYCFRNPDHAGRSLTRLFTALRIPLRELKGITAVTPQHLIIQKEEIRDYSDWRLFEPAKDDPEALAYLAMRKFEHPDLLSNRFGLKTVKNGKWAGRLIIPLTNGWTGRSMRPWIEPRYLANTDEAGFFTTSFGGPHNSTAIVCEGALDAMRIASVTDQFDIYAKCKMTLSAALLIALKQRQYMRIYHLPDSNVPYFQHSSQTHTLAMMSARKDALTLTLPEGYKDAADVPEKEIQRWLHNLR